MLKGIAILKLLKLANECGQTCLVELLKEIDKFVVVKF